MKTAQTNIKSTEYYNYSVKQLLTDYFGENAVFNMRIPHDSHYNSEDSESNILPLEWQYADEMAADFFKTTIFLEDTIICDDYIAYLCRSGKRKIAELMFILTEDEPPFHIDINYVKKLFSEWTSKGYETYILKICISVQRNMNSKRFCFSTHSSIENGYGCELFELKNINGNDGLLILYDECWELYDKKAASVLHGSDITEYECLFSPDVSVTVGDKKYETETICTGIDGLIDFFAANPPVEISYKELKDTETYRKVLISGKKILDIYVNHQNQISEINITEIGRHNDVNIVTEKSDFVPAGMQNQIPDIVSFRILDPIKMHGFVLQLNYGEDNIRNYYLYNFETVETPELCTINGYEFSWDTFCSAANDSKDNIIFSNGYTLKKHFLYYHSYRQVQPERTGNVVYDCGGIRLESVYMLPLSVSHNFLEQFLGHSDECFGPKKAWLDGNGMRTSDIALSSAYSFEDELKASQAVIEPTYKTGFIREDGSWLVPPIYDKAESIGCGCIKASLEKDGLEKTFLITPSGSEKSLDFAVEFENFDNNRSAFNIKEWCGEKPYVGYYWDYDWIKPGTWGFIDSEGNVIIEPKYTFVAGFFNGGGEHSAVARFVDGKLCWGVIDINGTEVIPCSYPDLYCVWGKAVAFQAEEKGLYGLMDYNGNVIAEPQFGYIEDYDCANKLIAAGDGGDCLGVFSVKLNKTIIPPEFDYISFDEHIISCELSYTSKDRYFDYSGKELDFSEFDYIYECGDRYCVRKGDKYGLIDHNKRFIVPMTHTSGFFDNKLLKRGLIESCKNKLKGLSTLSGEIIIPEVYSDISLCGCFIIAQKEIMSNFTTDTLFTLDGKAVLSGLYRKITVDTDKKIISAETPYGKVFYRFTY